MATGIHENTITSAKDIPFTYEIRLPREGQGREQPVLYISHNTKDFEMNYESMERELACVVWAFTKLRHLLEGSETVLITDHAPIREVLRIAATTQYSLRLDKFQMLLAPFIDKINVIYRPGKEMTNVDPLSRATWTTRPGEDTGIPVFPPTCEDPPPSCFIIS